MSEVEELFGSDLERRTLGNVPRYRVVGELVEVAVGDKFKDGVDDDGEPTRLPVKTQEVDIEEHLREANGYPEDWSFSTSILAEELRQRLHRDDASPSPSPSELEAVLVALDERGYIDRAGDAVSMTAAGFEALTS